MYSGGRTSPDGGLPEEWGVLGSSEIPPLVYDFLSYNYENPTDTWKALRAHLVQHSHFRDGKTEAQERKKPAQVQSH